MTSASLTRIFWRSCDKDPAATGPRGAAGHCGLLQKECGQYLAPVNGGRDCCSCTEKSCPPACVKALTPNPECAAVIKCPGVCPEPSTVPLDDWANSFTGENNEPLMPELPQELVPPGLPCAKGMPCCLSKDGAGGRDLGGPCVRADFCENFKELSNPHQPQWNKVRQRCFLDSSICVALSVSLTLKASPFQSMAGFPSFLDLLPPISEAQGGPGGVEDQHYRNRLRAVLATDEMIDNLVKTLTSLSLIDTTYMFCQCSLPGQRCAAFVYL